VITAENLPGQYRPYKSIIFCSNKIIGGGHIFAMGKNLPLLIGEGETSRIWLQAVSAPGSREFITVVNDSKSTHPAVSVKRDGKKIIVTVQGHTVISVEPTEAQRATVTELDLRPIGLNVFGNASSLNLGGMQLSQNTFSGVGVAFGLGS
jgi:hypothetical protein